MPRRRARKVRPEILNRWIRVDEIRFSVFRRAEKCRGESPRYESRPWIELRGEAEEPLGDAKRFTVNVSPDDSDEPGPLLPPGIGAILRLKPDVEAIVGVDSASFDRVWSLALAGQLRYCWMAFTQPYRRSARILSASFSNELEE